MAGQSGWYAVGRTLRELALGLVKSKPSARASKRQDTAVAAPAKQTRQQSKAAHQSQSFDDEASPGQFGEGATRDLEGTELRGLRPSYAPDADGDPDPGEVVWTWVPYVENDGRGKDRPALVIARIDDDVVAGCFLTTKQHRGYVSVGTGGWDSQGRESFLAPDRVLRITAEGMRREGHILGKEKFVNVVRVVAQRHGFSA